MYSLQAFGWERDDNGDVTVRGRVERVNPETGLIEVVADLTQPGIWWPEFWALLSISEQDDILQSLAPTVLMRAAGVE